MTLPKIFLRFLFETTITSLDVYSPPPLKSPLEAFMGDSYIQNAV